MRMFDAGAVAAARPARGPPLLRLDNGRVGRIDEHRAFRVHALSQSRLPFASPNVDPMSPASTTTSASPSLPAPTPRRSEALASGWRKRYGNAAPAEADVIVALGGDGFMLQTLHRFMASGKPIYGMHRGTVGFLMNDYSDRAACASGCAAAADHADPSAADARARRAGATRTEFHAFNEVSLFRQTYQAARLRILIDGEERLAGAGRRRRAGGDAGRLDRLQSLRPGTDHPDQRAR